MATEKQILFLQHWIVWFCRWHISSPCKILISEKTDSIQTSQTCHSVSFDTRNGGINLSPKIILDVTKVFFFDALASLELGPVNQWVGDTSFTF